MEFSLFTGFLPMLLYMKQNATTLSALFLLNFKGWSFHLGFELMIFVGCCFHYFICLILSPLLSWYIRVFSCKYTWRGWVKTTVKTENHPLNEGYASRESAQIIVSAYLSKCAIAVAIGHRHHSSYRYWACDVTTSISAVLASES